MLPRLSRWLPTPAWTRALLAPALVFLATALDRNYQTDFWHHLARGRAIVTQGALVNRDLFTYTVAGKPLQDNNWLSQLLYYGLFERGGLALVQLVNSLTLAVTIGVVVWMCRWRCPSLLIAGALGVFCFFGLWQLLIIRPQTFSLLLFVVLYAVLDGADRRRWLLLFPPVIMALWANLHGGFPIGLVLIGCFVVSAAWEGWQRNGRGVLRDGRLWAVAGCLAASVAATLANPYGGQVYLYVRTTSIAAAGRHIDEWVPPGLDLLVGKVWVLSVLLALVLFALPRRRPTAREVILLLCFLPLACGSVRMVTWWLIVFAPIAAGLLADNLPRQALEGSEPEPPSLAAAGLFGLLLLVCAGGALSLSDRAAELVGRIRPMHRDEDDLEAVARQLPDRAGGRIFSRFEWGEYLSWSLAPHGYTVFMDGRIEIFPDKVWADYSAVTRGRGDWEEILDTYHVDCLLLDKTYHADLLPQVERSPAWKRVFSSGKAVLFLRRPTETARAETKN
jgi:hypothetical protein